MTFIATLSLHDALPIFMRGREPGASNVSFDREERGGGADRLQSKALASAGLRPVLSDPLVAEDRKSTRLNSSHRCISYAVFCLKKKKSLPNTSTASETS